VVQGLLWDGSTGATSEYWNKHLLLRWQNKNGDWWDSTGATQGQTPFATVTSSPGSRGASHVFDVTTLVRAWLDQGNTGAILRTTGGGQVNYRSRQSGSPPRLQVTTSTGTFDCPCLADTYMQSGDVNSLGGQTVMKISNNLFNGAVQFDLTGVSGSVSSATMTLIADDQYSPATSIQVMRLRAPAVWVGDGGTVEQGIAANVVLDSGIESQPGFAYRKRFVSGWNADMVQYGPPQTSDPSPGSFSGSSNSVGSDAAGGLNLEYMRGTFPIDTNPALDGFGCTSMNANLRFRELNISEPDEAYVRWYLMIEDNWDTTVDVSKMPGLHSWVANPFDSGDPSSGANGWSARGHIGRRATDANPYADLRWCGNYVYHMDQAGGFGDSAYNWGRDGTQYRWGNFCLQKGRWYCIEQRVKLNTPGSADGVLEQWVNGVKVFSKTNLRWRNTTALKIQQVWFTWYHGGMQGSNVTMNWRMADFVMATRYIGPKRRA
jgi:hypothetical protein